MDEFELEQPLKGMTGVIYCRRSTNSKAQKESSLGRQREICRETASELVIVTAEQVYSEVCNSSKDAIEFEQLKSDVIQGKLKVDFLIVEKQDRLKRQYSDDRRDNLKPLHDAGIRIIWCIGGKSKIPQLLIAPQMDMAAKIIEVAEAGKNADYVADLADRLSHSMFQRAKRGTLTARHAFGWEIFREYDSAGHLISKETTVNEKDAKIVVEMFETFLKTQTLTDLIPILKKSERYPKKRCIACKERHNSIKGLAVEGTVTVCTREIEDFEHDNTTICNGTEFEDVAIQTPVIRSILRNASHAGIYTYFQRNTGEWRTRQDGKIVDVKMLKSVNKKIERRSNINPMESEVCIEDHHTGIIDRSLFLRVQEILDRNKTDNSCKGPKAKGLYTGRVICGTCGSRMTYGATQGRARYTCNNSKRSNTKRLCSGGTKSIRSDDLEQIVLDGVFDVLATPEFWSSKLREVRQLVQDREASLHRSRSDDVVTVLRNQIDQLDVKIDATNWNDQMQTIKGDSMIKQKIGLEKELNEITEEENKFRDNPVLKVLDRMRDGEKYRKLAGRFTTEDGWTLMGHTGKKGPSMCMPITEDSPLSDYSIFYLATSDDVRVGIEDIELFTELVSGDHWGLIAAGYLFSEFGLSDFQMSLLLAQSFGRWECDTDEWFVWDDFLDRVDLDFCPSEDAAMYPLAEKLVLKNQKQVCCSAVVTVDGQVWQNKGIGGESSRYGKKPAALR